MILFLWVIAGVLIVGLLIFIQEYAEDVSLSLQSRLQEINEKRRSSDSCLRRFGLSLKTTPIYTFLTFFNGLLLLFSGLLIIKKAIVFLTLFLLKVLTISVPIAVTLIYFIGGDSNRFAIMIFSMTIAIAIVSGAFRRATKKLKSRLADTSDQPDKFQNKLTYKKTYVDLFSALMNPAKDTYVKFNKTHSKLEKYLLSTYIATLAVQLTPYVTVNILGIPIYHISGDLIFSNQPILNAAMDLLWLFFIIAVVYRNNIRLGKGINYLGGLLTILLSLLSVFDIRKQYLIIFELENSFGLDLTAITNTLMIVLGCVVLREKRLKRSFSKAESIAVEPPSREE